MYLNGYYIRFVDSWDKQTKGQIKTSADAKYIKPKAENEIRITHKIKGVIDNKKTAEELGEMFANPNFNIAVISECDVPEYDGVYNLDKGNIIRDGGFTTWGVELWLSNKKNSIRHSVYQEDYDNDFAYLQSETDSYTALENYSGTATNDGSNGFYMEDELDFGYAHWNSFVTEYDVDLQKSGMYAHYKLNGDLTDSTGNHSDLTQPNIVNGSISFASGKLGDAASFIGTGIIRLDTSHNNFVNSRNTHFTIAAWVYIDSNWNTSAKDVQLTVIGNAASYGGSYGLIHGQHGDGMGFWFRPTSGSQAGYEIPPSEVMTDVWHHYVVSSNGTSTSFYWNGKLAYKTTLLNTTGGFLDAVPMVIGGTYKIGGGSTLGQFYGKIDDVRLYKVALDESEVEYLYNNGDGTEGESQNIIHRYEFNKREILNRNVTASSSTPIYHKSCYQVEITTGNKIRLNKKIDEHITTLAEADITVDLTSGNYQHIKIAYANNKCDVYFENEHVLSNYTTELVSGYHSLFGVEDSVKIKNLSVKKYIPYVHTVPTKEESYDNPSPISYVKTTDGLLRHHVNTDKEIIEDVFPSRALNGEVKVWDTMDNDFSQTYVPPKPLYWRRVYDPSHQFIGNIYIENGIYGILYSENGTHHYIYDHAHKRGTILNVDFKQNPNYIVWNESYDGRGLKSYNSGQSNWTEDGLTFDKNYAKQPPYTDLVKTNYIPQLYSQYITSATSYRVDFKFKFDSTRYNAGEAGLTHTITGRMRDAYNNPFNIYYYPHTKKLQIAIETNSPSNLQRALTTNANSFDHDTWYECTAIIGQDAEGMLLYANGELVHTELSVPYRYGEYSNGSYDIGDTSSGTFNTLQFHGEIEYVNVRLISEGETVPKSLYQPIIWHSFDEQDWDNVSSIFQDKGVNNRDISFTGTPRFVKYGRYNQCLSIGYQDGAYFDSSFSSISGMNGGFTAQMWVRIKTSFTTGNDYKHILCLTTGTSAPMLRFWGRTTGQLTLNFRDAGGSNHYVNYDVSAQSSNNHDVDNGTWYHIAAVWGGDADTTMYFYVNGELVNSYSSAPSIQDSFDRIRIGHEDDVDMEFDELMIHNYPLQPLEFGVMVKDINTEKQWYNKSEFEQLSNGKWIRKEGSKSASFELEYLAKDNQVFGNRITGVYGEKTGSQNRRGLALSYGAVGYGLSGSSDEADGGAGIYFNRESEHHLKLDEKFTLQWYYSKKQTPTNNGILVYLRADGETLYTNESQIYIEITTSNTFQIRDDNVSNSTFTLTTDNSFALGNNTMYHVAVTWDYPNKNINIYVDQVLYRTYRIDKIKAIRGGELSRRHIGLGTGFAEWEGTISNFTTHRHIIQPADFGIFCDLYNELPNYAFSYHRVAQGGSELTINKFRLQSISPDFVRIDILDEADNAQRFIPTYIQSGGYLYTIDGSYGLLGRGQEQSQIEVRFQESYRARFALGLSNIRNPTITDMGRFSGNTGLNISTTDNLPYRLLLDFPRTNMIFAAVTTKTQSDNNKLWITNNSRRVQDALVKAGDDGAMLFGFVPQRSVNQIFWDSTELDDVSTLSNETDNWFLSATRSTANATIANLEDKLNLQYYEKGLYLIILRGKVDAYPAFGGLRAYSDTLSKYVYGRAGEAQTEITGTSFSYYYTFFNIDGELIDQKIRFITATDSGSLNEVAIDYIMVLPITNGLNMPLDLIRQAETKRIKTKVVE